MFLNIFFADYNEIILKTIYFVMNFVLITHLIGLDNLLEMIQEIPKYTFFFYENNEFVFKEFYSAIK